MHHLLKHLNPEVFCTAISLCMQWHLSERQTPGDLCNPTALTALPPLLVFRRPAGWRSESFFKTPWERRPGVTAYLQETKLT